LCGTKFRVRPKSKIFNHKFKLNFGPIEYLKKKLLLLQINKHLNALRMEDEAVNYYGTDQIPNPCMREISYARGLNKNKSRAIKKELLRCWIPVS
jgi:hypothetical protein